MVKYCMRILVTIAQDSSELLEIALYCSRHSIDLRKETWQLAQEQYEFHVIYASAQDRAHINWLQLSYPGCFFEF